YMFGGEVKVPMVIRMPGGAGHQLSAQHSHSFEVLYGLIPGLLVVAPTTPEDAKGMLKSAIRSDNPVMFLESMSLYNVKGEVAAGVQERCFDYLDAPIRRLGGAQVPMPYNQQLERVSIPTSEDIKRLVRHTLGKNPNG